MTRFRETECSCATCQSMCKRIPCRPLPQEVMRMPRELQARLMFEDGQTLYETPHLMAAAKGYEGREAPDFAPFFGQVSNPKTCTFHTPDGRCELHGRCKPFEGRAADCNGTNQEGRDILEHLKREWRGPLGKRILTLWKKRHLRSWAWIDQDRCSAVHHIDGRGYQCRMRAGHHCEHLADGVAGAPLSWPQAIEATQPLAPQLLPPGSTFFNPDHLRDRPGPRH